VAVSRGRPKSSMAKQDRGRYRYRYRYRMARCHTAQESIPIPILISISIGRIGRIGSYCLEAEAEGLCSWGGSFATEGTEFTERFFLLPSAGRSALYQMGNGLRLCVLCDLCGRNLLTRGRPKSSMAKQDRGRGSVSVSVSKGQVPYSTGIDPDPVSDIDNDPADRQPLPGGDA
jgi:hypothetical protein